MSILHSRRLIIGSFMVAALTACSDEAQRQPDVPPAQSAAPRSCPAYLLQDLRSSYQGPLVSGAPLEGLKNGNRNFTPRDGTYKLVHFSKASSTALCSQYMTVILLAAEGLKQSCGGKMPPVEIYFVSPDAAYGLAASAPGNRSVTDLHGPQETVEALANRFGMTYYPERRPDLRGNTEQLFLVSPDGRNIMTFNSDALPDSIVGEVLEAMNMRRNPAPAATPGL